MDASREPGQIKPRTGSLVVGADLSRRRDTLQDGVGQLSESLHKDGYQLAVKLGVGAALELSEGVGGAARFLIGPVGGDSVVGVSDGDDARAQRNLSAVEGIRVTGAVEELVVMLDHLGDARDGAERLENLGAEGHVGLHGLPLLRIKRAALIQYGLR